MKTMLICPAWNEAGVVADVVADAIGAGYEIVVVDDGSGDSTGDIALRAGAMVARHPINLGVGAAVQTGIRIALRYGADAVVQVDADGQHLVAEVPRLVAPLSSSTHLVIGSRYADGAVERPGGLRSLGMLALAHRASRVAGTRITDASSGFRAISQPLMVEFARRFPSTYLGDTFGALLLASRLGYGVTEVPVTMQARQGGVPSTGTGRSAILVLRAISSSMTAETRAAGPRRT